MSKVSTISYQADLQNKPALLRPCLTTSLAFPVYYPTFTLEIAQFVKRFFKHPYSIFTDCNHPTLLSGCESNT